MPAYAIPTPSPVDLAPLLDRVAALHDHLCPRQVLGVRMGLAGGALLGLPLPQVEKRLLVVMETDGCGADGVAVATNCWVGRRTLRIEDYGKMAATFVDTSTDAAVRVHPRPEARVVAARMAGAVDRWHGMREGYKLLPTAELLAWAPVHLFDSSARLVSRPGLRVRCSRCGEEIMNGREVEVDGESLCRSCAGGGYYLPARRSLDEAVPEAGPAGERSEPVA